MTLHDKLIDIQQRLKVPKDINNSFGGFQYRNLETIEDKVKPMLKEHKLTLIFTDEVVEVASRGYVKAVAILSDGTDNITANAYAELQPKQGTKMSEPQLTGSSSSYARKYAAGGLFLIDDSKDDPDGHDNTQHESERTDFTPMNSLVKVDQVKQLLEAAKKASGLADREEILTWFRETVDMEPTQVKQIEFDNVLRWIEEEHV